MKHEIFDNYIKVLESSTITNDNFKRGLERVKKKILTT